MTPLTNLYTYPESKYEDMMMPGSIYLAQIEIYKPFFILVLLWVVSYSTEPGECSQILYYTSTSKCNQAIKTVTALE